MRSFSRPLGQAEVRNLFAQMRRNPLEMLRWATRAGVPARHVVTTPIRFVIRSASRSGREFSRTSPIMAPLMAALVSSGISHDMLTGDDYSRLLRLDETVTKPTAATDADLAALPPPTTLAADSSYCGERCTVCLDDLTEGTEVRILPCAGKHAFHTACIDQWLRVDGVCPVDKSLVVKRD
ncbi:uncharacterized protein AMSG_01216 [Thecamonas trahens ATCC 50062]|uniref:RING-type domain-containing protein n=1 Tax=Thecamonas trahens ATCC 50062 TaxID=461836 RepID=A0A0L0DPZ4_THETB|nr:hypothetical protein AMSG_01216 [Thecamonas trahens ATCC 50062]KNC53503.1 hypothetical protein AMSG_01216 [Thecamonas trahens ATCC 50062]|eukprot:XP_013761824.1 hypothetical protein AMSG_01216 [Thecamonas trahens ATCC 50062]